MKIWTDGGCHPNPGPGGWGWVRCDGVEEYGGDNETTNNRMEMTAILKALSKLPDGQAVTLYSDSQYCVKGLTIWRNGWRKKNWMKNGSPMINRDLWIEIDLHVSRINARFEWVKGHNGNAMNEKADQLATLGRNSLPTQNSSDSLVDERSLMEREIINAIKDSKRRIEHLESLVNQYFRG